MELASLISLLFAATGGGLAAVNMLNIIFRGRLDRWNESIEGYARQSRKQSCQPHVLNIAISCKGASRNLLKLWNILRGVPLVPISIFTFILTWSSIDLLNNGNPGSMKADPYTIAIGRFWLQVTFWASVGSAILMIIILFLVRGVVYPSAKKCREWSKEPIIPVGNDEEPEE